MAGKKLWIAGLGFADFAEVQNPDEDEQVIIKMLELSSQVKTLGLPYGRLEFIDASGGDHVYVLSETLPDPLEYAIVDEFQGADPM